MLLKKFLLAGFVVISFALYSFHARHGDAVSVLAPSVPNQNTATLTPTAPTTNPTTNSNTNPNPATTSQPVATGAYKDGQYTGSAADAFYGFIQVKATINGGKITDIQFLQYPNNRNTSVEINRQAMPMLKQEALSAQNAHVDIISGATDTSQAFIESLNVALSQAGV